jgi:hypothetical protein
MWLYPFVTLALEEGGWSAPGPGRFTPGKDPILIVIIIIIIIIGKDTISFMQGIYTYIP